MNGKRIIAIATVLTAMSSFAWARPPLRVVRKLGAKPAVSLNMKAKYVSPFRSQIVYDAAGFKPARFGYWAKPESVAIKDGAPLILRSSRAKRRRARAVAKATVWSTERSQPGFDVGLPVFAQGLDTSGRQRTVRTKLELKLGTRFSNSRPEIDFRNVSNFNNIFVSQPYSQAGSKTSQVKVLSLAALMPGTEVRVKNMNTGKVTRFSSNQVGSGGVTIEAHAKERLQIEMQHGEFKMAFATRVPEAKAGSEPGLFRAIHTAK